MKWEHLEPICEDLLGRVGAKDAKATFADFLWAYSTFWSDASAPLLPEGAILVSCSILSRCQVRSLSSNPSQAKTYASHQQWELLQHNGTM